MFYSQKFSIQHESLEFESKILRIENSHQHPCEILMPGFYKPNLNRKTGHNFARGKVISDADVMPPQKTKTFAFICI